MSIYAIPGDLNIDQAIYEVFQQYCSAWKSNIAKNSLSILDNPVNNNSNNNQTINHEYDEIELGPCMDAASFAKLIRDSPGLAKNIGRTEVN